MNIYKYPNQGPRKGIPSSFNYFSTSYRILTCPHRAEACVWNFSHIYNQCSMIWISAKHPHLKFLQSLVLVLEERDAEELVLVLAGYFNLATDLDLAVTHVKSTSDEQCEYNLRGIFLNKRWDIFVILDISDLSILGSECSLFVNMSSKLVEVNFAFGSTMFPAWKLFCRCGMSRGGSRDWPFQSKQGQFPLNAKISIFIQMYFGHHPRSSVYKSESRLTILYQK